MLKIAVIDGGDFRYRWNGLCISVSEYESIGGEDYDDQLHYLFEYCSFVFDGSKHYYSEEYK